MQYKHHGKWMFSFWKAKVRHRKGGFKTKQDAAIAEVMARKNLKGMNLDFTLLCENRLRELKSRRTPKWFHENELLINRLVELWGRKKEITRQDVEDYVTSITAKSQANAQLKMIKALFKHGIEKEIWTEDPTARIKKFPVAKSRKYIPPLEDLKLVLALADPMDRLYLLVLAHSLGRVNAVNQLRWPDIHDNDISLYTRKARNSDLKEIKVPSNEVLRATLKQIPVLGEFVFMNPKTGKPYVYRKRLLKGLCKKAKVKYFTFHCIRHLTASLLDSKNVPLTDIQKLLGHERATTTDIYLQSLRGSTDESVKHLECIATHAATTEPQVVDNQTEKDPKETV